MFELKQKIDIIRKQSICERKAVSVIHITSFSQGLIKAKNPKSNSSSDKLSYKNYLAFAYLSGINEYLVVYRSYFMNYKGVTHYLITFSLGIDFGSVSMP